MEKSWLPLYITCTHIYLQERQYKQISSVDQLAIHFALDGNMLHKDSDEAKRQRTKLGLPEGIKSIYFSNILVIRFLFIF